MVKFLSEKAYAKVMEALIIVCADAVITNFERKTFYLAKRKTKPAQGWWWMGGRMFAFEDEVDAVKRCFKRETSLDIERDRFRFVRMYRYTWKDREQKPQNRGSDTLAYTFAIELSYEEIILVSQNLDEKEYEREIGLQEFNRDRMEEEHVHPAILDLYDHMFPSTDS